MTQYHLLKANGKWRLQKEGSEKALFAAETKAEALDELGDYMDDREGSVLIHKADGAFQESRSYPRETRNAEDTARSKKTWGIVGVAALAAMATIGVLYRFRHDIPTDRLRWPGNRS